MSRSLEGSIERLFAGGGLLFFGLVLELGVSFLAKAVIARVLGPVDYGAVSLGVTTLGLLSTFGLLGLHTGVARYLPRFDNDADRRGVLVSAFGIVVPVVTALGLLVAGLAGPIATHAFGDPSVAPFVRIFGLAIPFAALTKLSVGAIQGLQQAAPKVVVQNITPPVTRFLAVAVAVLVGAGAVGVASAYALAYVAAAVVGLAFVVRRTPIFASVSPTPMRRDLLAFSAPLVVSAAMGFVLTDLDTFMLGYFASTEAVGVYNVVYPVAQLLTVALTSFGFLFMPIISELHANDTPAEMRRIYQVVTKWVFVATLPVFLVVALFSDMTIAVTFGSEYRPGATALTLLALAYFTHSVAGPNANTLTAIGRTRLVMWDSVGVGVINAGLNLLLIPTYGYLGAGAATAISYATLNLLYAIQLYRATGIHPFSRGLVRPGVVAIVLVAVVHWATRTFFPITVPVLVGMFVVFMTAYVIIILRFGGIEAEEVALVLSFEERFDIDLGPLKALARVVME